MAAHAKYYPWRSQDSREGSHHDQQLQLQREHHFPLCPAVKISGSYLLFILSEQDFPVRGTFQQTIISVSSYI
jgi:hypothetical protein